MPRPPAVRLLAGGLYLLGVAICRALAPASVKTRLAFDAHAVEQAVPPTSIVDVASGAAAAVLRR